MAQQSVVTFLKSYRLWRPRFVGECFISPSMNCCTVSTPGSSSEDKQVTATWSKAKKADLGVNPASAS